MNRFIITTMAAALAVAAASGCKDEPQPGTSSPSPSGGGTAASGAKADDHEHADGTKHAHEEKPAAASDHPNRVDLGSTTAGGLTLKATQDEPIKAGGDGAFELAITGGKPKAVRFWVGTESGEGSVKAKAAEETPDNWHTHLEVPDPLPAGSKFWAEVEPATGAKFAVSFDLK